MNPKKDVSFQNNKVLGLGIAVLDYLLLLDHYPRCNEKTEAIDSDIQSGGPIATAVTAVAKLGGSSSLFTVLGSDYEGRKVYSFLRNAGVDTLNIIFDTIRKTPKANIWIDKRSGDRTVVLDHKNSRLVTPQEIKANLFDHVKVFLTDGRGFETNVKALKLAKAHQATTVLDAGSPRKGMARMLPFVDYFICSKDYAVQTTGLSNIRKAFQSIRDQYNGTIIITLGQEGCIFSGNRKISRMKALTINATDTTGAGDIFHGAFTRAIASYAESWSFWQILRYCITAASLSCRYLGGPGSVPGHDEVLERMIEIPEPFEY
jgi:sugar/nucleoside kinase (ribokinase family)